MHATAGLRFAFTGRAVWRSLWTAAWLGLAAGALAGNFYAGTSPANVPWPGGIVPYEFTNTLTAAQKQTYLDGLREWELAANVKFIPHTNQSRWILFDYNTNGSDTVLSGYSPQVVTISLLSRAQVCHEMGHSFGFTHENIRPDATNYLSVLTNNIANEPVNITWFVIDPTSVTNGPYDFESVMHLGWDFASLNPGGLATQTPKPPYSPRYQFRMGNYCLSPGDRAALRYLYGPPAVPLTNIVTTTADSGPGSLRAAMYYAADHPGTAVQFNIPTSDPGYSNGVFNIHLSGHLPPLATNGMVIDGSTQPGFSNRPLIIVDGSQILPETGTANSGLLIYSANNQIKNLSFQRFNWNGLTLEYADATNNTIAGCWLGLDYTGTNAAGNQGQGILLQQGAAANLIGGTNALARTVLSGNQQYGIFITDLQTTNNLIQGSYLGCDASGLRAVPNWLGGAIVVSGAHKTVFGGATPLARNILSGNTNFGLWLGDSTTASNTVSGNYFGLNAAGTAALPNTFAGMYILNGSHGNTVTGNVFSGQPSEGLRLADPGTTGNTVQGNSFGLDATGTHAIPNGFAGLTLFNGANSNHIGGTAVTARNLLSGNGSYGLVMADFLTRGNLVEGNWLGVDSTGTNALNNGTADVGLWNGANGNWIGGVSPGAGNLIANSFYGVALYDNPTTNNSIRGNAIFSTIGLGIDLNADGVTANHVGGAVPGPNHYQNYPVLTNAYGSGPNTLLSGTLNSAALRSFWVDFYRNAAPASSGHGPGQAYVGTTAVTTDASGSANFALAAGGNFSGQYFSATATDQITGDTSEFSVNLLATNGPPPPGFVSPFGLTPTGFVATLSLTIGQSYRVQATTNLGATPVMWTDLTNFTAPVTNFLFRDRSATNYPLRFYRVVSP